MEAIEAFIPIVLFVCVFGMIIMVAKYDRDAKLQMIEKGMNPNEKKKPGKGGTFALKGGLAFIGAGIGLFLARLIETYSKMDGEAIYFGLISLFAGIGLVIAHQIARKQEKEDGLY